VEYLISTVHDLMAKSSLCSGLKVTVLGISIVKCEGIFASRGSRGVYHVLFQKLQTNPLILLSMALCGIIPFFCTRGENPFTLDDRNAQNGHFQARVRERFCHESRAVAVSVGLLLGLCFLTSDL